MEDPPYTIPGRSLDVFYYSQRGRGKSLPHLAVWHLARVDIDEINVECVDDEACVILLPDFPSDMALKIVRK